MNPRDAAEARLACMRVALGQEPADLVIENGVVADVHLGRLVRADVAIKAGRIAAVGSCADLAGPATERYDASGSVVAPGFIDGHTHEGSAVLSMSELAKALLVRGTVAISTDFHIPAMVGGVRAIRHLLDELALTPLRVLYTVGYQMYTQNDELWNTETVAPADLMEALDWPETVGISEWLLWHYAEAERYHPVVMDLLREVWRRRMLLVGHAHSYGERELQAYAALDARSDHEATSVDEVVDRLSLGYHVMLKENAAVHFTRRVVPDLVRERVPLHDLSWSSDGLSGAFVVASGHVDEAIREAIAAGMAPMQALQMATINPARYFRLEGDLGSVAPGRRASLVLVDDLDAFHVRTTFADGAVVAAGGRFVGDVRPPQRPPDYLRTMRLPRPLTPEDFRVAAPSAGERVRTRVIGLADPITRTVPLELDLPVEQGVVLADRDQDVVKIVVVDRNTSSMAIGRCFLHGTGLRGGAIGLSSTGGTADVGILGADDADIAAVANALREMGGGAAVAVGGAVVARVATPVLGLFSDEPVEEVLTDLEALEAAANALGAKVPLWRALRFAALPRAVPSWKVCQRGLCEVGPRTSRLLPMFVEP